MLKCGQQPAACRVCKDVLCASCAEKCQRCGCYVCDRHVAACLGCGLPVCGRCGGVECETCGLTACKEHSLRCKVCLMYFCDEHAQLCAVCNQVVCDSHVVACARCQTSLCPRHGRRRADDPPGCRVCDEQAEGGPGLLFCDYCQTLLPGEVLTPHDGSDRLICMRCRLKCFECDGWSPEFDFVKCVACDLLLCAGCLDDHADMCPALGRELVTDFG